MKPRSLYTLLVVSFLFVGATLYTTNQSREQIPDDPVTTLPITTENGTILQVEIAKTDEERRKGLSQRHTLETDGMLFFFPEMGTYAFWMRDTYIPLDIIWLDDKKRIVHVERNVLPETYPTTFTAPTPAQFVLELAAGQSDILSLTQGSLLSWDT